MDRTLTDTTTLNQRGPESNGNEKLTLHSFEFENWRLTIKYSLVS